MARAEAQLSNLYTLDGQPPDKQGRPTPKGTQQNGHCFCLCVYVEGPHKQSEGIIPSCRYGDLRQHSQSGTQHLRQIDLL